MRNFFLASKREKGVSILLAVLILSILLAIALGISYFITQQMKMMREVGYSIQAFYAADSGIEEALLSENLPLSGSVNGISYNVTCECCNPQLNPNTCLNPGGCPSGCSSDPDGDCKASIFCLKSIGILTAKGIRRAIQVDY